MSSPRSPAEDRTLSALVRTLPAAMWPAMSRWHGEGASAKFFDGAGEDTLELADWQVIDLAGAASQRSSCSFSSSGYASPWTIRPRRPA